MGTLGIISLIVGAIAAIAGTAVTASSIHKTNETNKQIAAMQNQWNVEQWQRENAYNDPAQQVQRLAAAGINPSLAVGQSGLVDAGNAQSVHPAAGATMQPFQMDGSALSAPINQAALMDSQIKANEAYAENQSAQANETSSLLDPKLKQFDQIFKNLGEEQKVLSTKIQEMQSNIANMNQDTISKAFGISHQLWIENLGDKNYQLELARYNETVPTLRAAAKKDNALASYWSSMKKLTDQDLELARLTLLHKAIGARIDNSLKYQQLGLGRQQFMLNANQLEQGEEVLKQMQFNTTKMGFDNPFSNFIHSASNDNWGNRFFKQVIVNAKASKLLFDGIVDSYRPFIDAGSRIGAANAFSHSTKDVFMHYGK